MGGLLVAANAQGFTTPNTSSWQLWNFNIANAGPNACVTLAVGYDGGTTTPVGNCTPISPIPQVQNCTITGNTVLDHGQIPDSVRVNAASTRLRLSCSLNGSIVLFAGTESYTGLVLDNSRQISATLTINGQDATEGVTVQVRANQPVDVDVGSTVWMPAVVGPTALGPFSGTSILKVSPP